jgi:N-acetylglutamate synthase
MNVLPFEEHLFRAWPALTTRHYDGWVLRFAEGFTRRSNSVNPIYGSSINLSEKIDHCEALYTQEGIPTHFRLTDCVQPAGLDVYLAERGYSKSPAIDVFALDLKRVNAAASDVAVSIEPRLTDGWLRDHLHITGLAAVDAFQQMMQVVYLPAAFITLRQDDMAVATGVAVAGGDYMGLFRLAVDARFRRNGLGKALTLTLLDWGQQQGASCAYLQVEPDNVAARNLYTGLGFEKIYDYWYQSCCFR